ncbi:MAG: hypothetical protein LBU83_13190 [Bacteroidales bacterium]|jgi:hypothetical protein|nr:hypothetical protein [Bacteroidales bacterium]
MKAKQIGIIISIFFIVQVTYSQSNGSSEIPYFILELLENARLRIKERQSNIISFNDLAGTFWVPDEEHNSHEPPYKWGFAFLDDGTVLILDLKRTLPIIPDINFSISSIVGVVKYRIEANKMFIFNQTSCYLENTFLYIGDDSYGFFRYRLFDTFTIYDH